jgi:hypothetical protein
MRDLENLLFPRDSPADVIVHNPLTGTISWLPRERTLFQIAKPEGASLSTIALSKGILSPTLMARPAWLGSFFAHAT